MHVEQMISSHPDVRGATNDTLLRCIEECYACAQACTACADACLAEEEIDMLRQCIRLNLDCADVCAAAGSIASRRTGGDERGIAEVLRACAILCSLCGGECEKHAMTHDHCRVCADACHRCLEACNEAIGTMGSVH